MNTDKIQRLVNDTVERMKIERFTDAELRSFIEVFIRIEENPYEKIEIEKKSEKVDETIEVICDWIKEEKEEYTGRVNVPDMIKALADLATARTSIKAIEKLD